MSTFPKCPNAEVTEINNLWSLTFGRKNCQIFQGKFPVQKTNSVDPVEAKITTGSLVAIIFVEWQMGAKSDHITVRYLLPQSVVNKSD